MELYQALKKCLMQGQLVTLATVIAGAGLGRKLLIWPDNNGRTQGSLGHPELEQQAIKQAHILMAAQQSGRKQFTFAGESAELFFEVYLPQLKLIMVGAVHIAVPLTTFAKTLGFHTIIVDARPMFATRERFPHVDELIVRWPDEALAAMSLNEGCYIVTLTHDEKLDNPALAVAVRSDARYIGALGARSTHAKRVAALKMAGLSEEQLARIHAPIGLNLGARGPEEIAISIIAEIVAVKRGMAS